MGRMRSHGSEERRQRVRGHIVVTRQARPVPREIAVRWQAEPGEGCPHSLEAVGAAGGRAGGRHRGEQRFRVAVATPLHEDVDDLEEWRRSIDDELDVSLGLRRLEQVVDVGHRSRHRDAVAREHVAQRLEIELGRIVHRGEDGDRLCVGRNLSAHVQKRRPRDPRQADARGRRRGGRLHFVDDEDAAADRRRGDDRGRAGCEAGTDDDLDLALVVLQRANRRGVAVLQVVPGPADAPAGLGERVVVANHVARDHPDALGLEFRGPALERVPTLGMSRVDGRIAVADDDQIAIQRAFGTWRSSGDESGREAVIPAKSLSGGGRRQELLVRGGDQEFFGVVAEDDRAIPQ